MMINDYDDEFIIVNVLSNKKWMYKKQIHV